MVETTTYLGSLVRTAALSLMAGILLTACQDEPVIIGPESAEVPVSTTEGIPPQPQSTEGNLLSELAVVIDPETLALVGAAAERADGIYKVRRLSETAPQIAVGNYIIGTGDEDFLRRVTEVEESRGDLILNTAVAYWPEVIVGVRIEGTVPIGSQLAPTAAAGASVAAASAVPLPPISFNFDGFDICAKITELNNKFPILMPDLCNERISGEFAVGIVSLAGDVGVTGLLVEEGVGLA